MSKLSRRNFMKTGLAIGASSFIFKASPLLPAQPEKKIIAIASSNGLKATERAMELLRQGADPLDAVIAGVNLVEEDPEDTSVGYGGLPNEEGEVELDASVMHGPTHNAGAVAALRGIKTPSKVAKLVMERCDHALLVGEGALKFAKAHGFKEENLLTERAREIWLRWKETLSERDNWFPPKSEKLPAEVKSFVDAYGTINCLALDSQGNLAGVTTTSGLAFKLPGRVGDSPIIGAGLYVDNDIGAAGSTGRGEANLLNCGSFQVVNFMAQGYSPEEACLRTLQKIAEKTKYQPHLLDKDGLPRFGLNFYALNKKGEFGAASMWSGAYYAVHDGRENKLREAAYLFKRKK
ncbi:MAG: N(4)-(beta-N-acetylglucosaminyl)-L-asparaginase [Candidatus Aminicenantes bacterium]|nr:N(4)-(beta-N-acetylglucosaminyl)-L-asparaginase [Candidatus Aminicenantes bacterium]